MGARQTRAQAAARFRRGGGAAERFSRKKGFMSPVETNVPRSAFVGENSWMVLSPSAVKRSPLLLKALP